MTKIIWKISLTGACSGAPRGLPCSFWARGEIFLGGVGLREICENVPKHFREQNPQRAKKGTFFDFIRRKNGQYLSVLTQICLFFPARRRGDGPAQLFSQKHWDTPRGVEILSVLGLAVGTGWCPFGRFWAIFGTKISRQKFVENFRCRIDFFCGSGRPVLVF